jgi:hypothetical protein
MDTVNKVVLSIGVDLGQRRDPTAVSVVELVDVARIDEAPKWRYETRHIERLQLGTKYPKVAARVAEIQENAIRAAQQREFNKTSRVPDVFLQTYIDATGAVPALDFFREAGLDIIPCFFTHGDRRTESDGQITIGKAWLVNRLQSLAQGDRLLLPPQHAEAAAMIRELQDYEIKVDQDANDKYGAFKVGSHDDLVTSLGLAVQWAPQWLTSWREIAAAFGRDLSDLAG